MAKRTWVNVNGVYKEVKNVWQNIDGVWRDKVMPKGVISGLGWKEFMEYMQWFYNRGIYEDLWENRYQRRDGETFRKEADHLYLSASSYGVWQDGYWSSASGKLVVHIKNGIDVTDLNSITIIYDAIFNSSGSYSSPGYYSIIVTPLSGDAEVYTEQSEVNKTVHRSITIDVSNLTGEVTVEIIVNGGSASYADLGSGSASLKVYEVWGD